MIPIVLVNGRAIIPDHAGISPLDRGLTLGDGLFETIKVEHGVAWYLERHIVRLEHAAQRVGIRYPKEIRQWVRTALETPVVASHSSSALRITLTRGITARQGLSGSDESSPTTVVALYAAPTIPSTLHTVGLTLSLASAPRNERAYTAGLKTTSYIESVLALHEAQAAGYDDALFLDTRGFVSEASTSNIFAWIGDTLVTPSHDCGILPGITRAIILELAQQQGIATEERACTLQELTTATEIFCTSSLRGIAPVVRIDDTVIGTGVPAARTLQLIASYAALQERQYNKNSSVLQR